MDCCITIKVSTQYSSSLPTYPSLYAHTIALCGRETVPYPLRYRVVQSFPMSQPSPTQNSYLNCHQRTILIVSYSYSLVNIFFKIFFNLCLGCLFYVCCLHKKFMPMTRHNRMGLIRNVTYAFGHSFKPNNYTESMRFIQPTRS